MHKLIAFLVFGFISFSCGAKEPEYYVSIFELVVNPEKYDNKKVAVKGFLGPTRTHLFVSKEFANMRDTSSSVGIDLESLGEPTDCARGYLQIHGRVQKTPEFWKLFEISEVYSYDSMKPCDIVPWES